MPDQEEWRNSHQDIWNDPAAPGPVTVAALALEMVARDPHLISHIRELAAELEIEWDDRIRPPYVQRCARSIWRFRQSAKLERVTRI